MDHIETEEDDVQEEPVVEPEEECTGDCNDGPCSCDLHLE